MKIACLQHVAFEGPANIEVWARAAGHTFSVVPLHQGAPLPALGDFDGLVVMGGPMGVDDVAQYPYLADEVRLIATAIHEGKRVLGICLGAQLIAKALGARVVKNRTKEIGWMPVTLTPAGKNSSWFRGFPDSFVCMHWHGDRFDIPEGAHALAESEACAQQAFAFADCALALQFHLEFDENSVRNMLTHARADLDGTPFTQSAQIIAGNRDHFFSTRSLLELILNRVFPR